MPLSFLSVNIHGHAECGRLHQAWERARVRRWQDGEKGSNTGMIRSTCRPAAFCSVEKQKHLLGQKHPHCASRVGVPASGLRGSRGREPGGQKAQPGKPAMPSFKLRPTDKGRQVSTVGNPSSKGRNLGHSFLFERPRAQAWANPTAYRLWNIKKKIIDQMQSKF